MSGKRVRGASTSGTPPTSPSRTAGPGPTPLTGGNGSGKATRAHPARAQSTSTPALAPASERPRPVTQSPAPPASPTSPSHAGGPTESPSHAPAANAIASGRRGALTRARGRPAPHRTAGSGGSAAGGGPRGGDTGGVGRPPGRRSPARPRPRSGPAAAADSPVWRSGHGGSSPPPASRPSNASRAATIRAARPQLMPARRASWRGVARFRSSRGRVDPETPRRPASPLASGGSPTGRSAARRRAAAAGARAGPPPRSSAGAAPLPAGPRSPGAGPASARPGAPEEAAGQERHDDHLPRTIREPLGQRPARGPDRPRDPARLSAPRVPGDAGASATRAWSPVSWSSPRARRRPAGTPRAGRRRAGGGPRGCLAGATR